MLRRFEKPNPADSKMQLPYKADFPIKQKSSKMEDSSKCVDSVLGKLDTVICEIFQYPLCLDGSFAFC